MSKLLGYFVRGLVVVAPLGVTVWICVRIFRTIDSWLGLTAPGVGFVITIVLITLVGFLASTIVARRVVSAMDSLFERVPFVRLLYGSTKDTLNAFVGEKRRFDKPVLVSVSADGATKMIGFLTTESAATLGHAGSVTVYIPQSYGFAGQLLVIPADRVQRIDAEASNVMAYVLSGGVTEVDVRRD